MGQKKSYSLGSRTLFLHTCLSRNGQDVYLGQVPCKPQRINTKSKIPGDSKHKRSWQKITIPRPSHSQMKPYWTMTVLYPCERPRRSGT